MYNSIVAAGITEFALFAGAVVFSASTTKPIDRAGRWSLLATLLFLATLPAQGAIPGMIILPTLTMVLLWPLGNWMDRHRMVTLGGREVASAAVAKPVGAPGPPS